MNTISIRIIATIASILLFTSTKMFSQEIIQDKQEIGKYCTILKDGSMKLEKDGVVATKEITLRDGSKITREGTVLRKDGTNVILKNGECIDLDGNIENIPLEKMEEKNNLTDADKKK
ncbi:MAG: DUF6799 domain-containing protein [Bacteroidia bacterium]